MLKIFQPWLNAMQLLAVKTSKSAKSVGPLDSPAVLTLKGALNGVDRFMFSLDEQFLRHSGRRNICVITLDLDTFIAKHALLSILQKSNVFNAITKLRLRRFRLALSLRWEIDPNSDQVTVDEVFADQVGSIESYVSNLDIDPYNSPPVQCHLFHSPDQFSSTIIFIWHHSFLDAHGAEDLILDIARNSGTSPQLGQGRELPSKLTDSFISAMKAKKFIFEKAKGVCNLKNNFKSEGLISKSKPSYHQIIFDEYETAKIKLQYERFNAELFKSSFHLAAVACTINDLFPDALGSDQAFHIPVPHDLRRSRKNRLLLSNQLSFLFFRLTKENFGSLELAYSAIINQAVRQIELEVPKKFLDFFQLASYLPPSYLCQLVMKPTSGKFATFFFSDIGDSTSRFRNFGPYSISNVRHYPPHFIPPGLSIVFCKHARVLKVILVASSEIADSDFVPSFEMRLRDFLLGRRIGNN